MKAFNIWLFFSFYCSGVINRGDSFRRRRSRSGSTNPPVASPMRAPEQVLPVNTGPQDSYTVAMIGGAEVGKAALIAQFQTSECINAYEDGAGMFGNWIIREENYLKLYYFKLTIMFDEKPSQRSFSHTEFSYS